MIYPPDLVCSPPLGERRQLSLRCFPPGAPTESLLGYLEHLLSFFPLSSRDSLGCLSHCSPHHSALPYPSCSQGTAIGCGAQPCPVVDWLELVEPALSHTRQSLHTGATCQAPARNKMINKESHIYSILCC